MAMMINCATDWTYDLFCNDLKNDANDFVRWLKKRAAEFSERWIAAHDGKKYDPIDGYVGDAFADEIMSDCFSDWYKDEYNQRPHLDRWFYVHPLGLPMSKDVTMTFCMGDRIEDAKDAAKHERGVSESYDPDAWKTLTVTGAELVEYLQHLMDIVKRDEADYGLEDRIVQKRIEEMIACNEMVERLINEPVNLSMDGKVTVGF